MILIVLEEHTHRIDRLTVLASERERDYVQSISGFS